jgi:hypothetical protein
LNWLEWTKLTNFWGFRDTRESEMGPVSGMCGENPLSVIIWHCYRLALTQLELHGRPLRLKPLARCISALSNCTKKDPGADISNFFWHEGVETSKRTRYQTEVGWNEVLASGKVPLVCFFFFLSNGRDSGRHESKTGGVVGRKTAVPRISCACWGKEKRLEGGCP